MIHVPSNPLVVNVFHPSANRLAHLVSSLRSATPVKVGSFFHTFTMSQSAVGTNRVVSITLHSIRNMNVRSGYLLSALESNFFLHNWPDILECLKNVADEFNMSEEYVKDFIGEPMHSSDQITISQQSSTYIPMAQTMPLKE